MNKPPLTVSALATAVMAAGTLVLVPTPATAAEQSLRVHSSTYPNPLRTSEYVRASDSFEGAWFTVSAEVEVTGPWCEDLTIVLWDPVDYEVEAYEYTWQRACPGERTAVSAALFPYHDWNDTLTEPGDYELQVVTDADFTSGADHYEGDGALLGTVDVLGLEHLSMRAALSRTSVLQGQSLRVTAQLQAQWSDGTIENAPGGWDDQVRVEFRAPGGNWSPVTAWRSTPSRASTLAFDVAATRSGEYRVTSRYGGVLASSPVAVTVPTVSGPYRLTATASTASKALAGQTITLRSTAKVGYSDGC